jgi:hypothetical protein
MAPTESHVDSLAAVVELLQLRPEDGAAVRLAQEYAAALDADDADVTKLGPPYLAALTALGLTPAARAALTGRGGAARGERPNPLDELRKRRAARGD